MKTELILAPYMLGHEGVGMGAGPGALEDEARAILGPTRVERIKLSSSFPNEVGACFDLNRAVARAVTEARERGAVPVVVAGNCHTQQGVIAGRRTASCLLALAISTRVSGSGSMSRSSPSSLRIKSPHWRASCLRLGGLACTSTLTYSTPPSASRIRTPQRPDSSPRSCSTPSAPSSPSPPMTRRLTTMPASPPSPRRSWGCLSERRSPPPPQRARCAQHHQTSTMRGSTSR